MKTFLFSLKRAVWAVSLLGTISSVSAQQPGLKTSANRITGKQIYHQSKIYDSKGAQKKPKVERVMEDIQARMDYDFQRLKVPGLNKIPTGIREAELKFSSTIPSGDDSKQSIASVAKSSKAGSFSYWENRGPYNVGGRTRALAIDRTNENVIFAGGVSGGLWRSTNGGQSWRKVTNSRQSPSITCIVQDPRPGKHNTWYYGSGERFGNSAGAGGAFYRGTGIYKSTNGGRTWRLLSATNDGTIGSSAFPFYIINSIIVDPTNGDVYVGTVNGLQRSQDGGVTFTEVLASGFLGTVEVAVSSTGQLYATIRSNAQSNPGFFTSSDGDTWTNITPEFLPPTIGRTIMEINPSNENEVYFLAQNTAGAVSTFLLKYDTTAASEEAWTDLTANLPTTIGGAVGNLNLQGGYNMVLEVSPADSNLMFVGGTNLYRSTTGFTTPAGQESWIAGYSPINDVSQYPDQHPDQHALLFYPSNPNKVLTGSDGGVSVTEDIRTTTSEFEPVDWISLNQGYLTTQPYHVSFDPDANSDDLLAGFQDNSTWYTNSTDPKATWEDIFGGDGSYSAIADGGRTRYVSSQNGRVHRLNYDEAGELVSFTRVQPAGATGFGFIAPFILDHNNDNIMYMPAGNRIWRNNNLDEIPTISSIGNSVFAGNLATVNWVNLPNSDTPAGSTITSLEVSTYPVANRLYYGTNQGGVYRMDNANIDGQVAIDISTGKGLPVGNVNDINVDPSNSDRVIITFSNYGVISLFFTDNGGDTWTNISGNLEENADGTGNGPSVRSTAFLGGSQGFLGSRIQKVFAATSTGLYYTNRLNGERTRWIKERFAIGNAVTDEVRTRKDGFIAVAAHGSGLYSARFPLFNELPEASLSVAYLLDDIVLDINKVEDLEIDVTDLFVSSNGAAVNVEFANSNPDMVTATLEGNTIKLVFNGELTLGDQATIELVATSGQEQVAEGFTISVSEIPVYEQFGGAVTSLPSQFFVDFGGLAQSADDFTVPAGNTWTVERILAFGGANNSPQLVNATVIIYQDNAGVPGEEVYNSGEIAPISDPTDVNLNLRLPQAVALEGGNYWISVYANLAFNPNATQWFWSSQNGLIGQESYFKDDLNLFGTGATDWTPASIAFGRNSNDQVFQIFGVENDGSAEAPGAAVAQPLATFDSGSSMSIYPNPSNGEFFFNFKNLESAGNIDIKVYDIAGNMVYAKSGLKSNSSHVWNAPIAPGFYIANISGAVNTTLKLIKQ